jgi:hypothetical protein
MTNVVNSTMSLGVVMVDNQPYIATLHFRTPEGTDRPITDAVVKVKSTAHKLFQEVVANRPLGSTSLANRGCIVSRNGFGCEAENSIPVAHTEASQRAFEKFLALLDNPALALHMNGVRGVEVELTPIDLTLLQGVNLKQLGNSIYEKIWEAYQTQPQVFPQLDDQEKLFLKYGDPARENPYPGLLAGNFNLQELRKLKSNSILTSSNNQFNTI